MEDLFREGQITIRGDKTPTGEIPNWIDIILEYLLRHFQITSPDLINLYKEVKENGFENIPTLDILSTLNAFQCIYHKKMTTNDEIDNLRIACGLPISNILFTDKRRKSEIEQLGLNQKYQCKVLCGSKNDLGQFKEILNEIKTISNN